MNRRFKCEQHEHVSSNAIGILARTGLKVLGQSAVKGGAVALRKLKEFAEVTFEAMPVPTLVDSAHGLTQVVLVLGTLDGEVGRGLEQLGFVLKDALKQLLFLEEQLLDVLVAFLLLGLQLPSLLGSAFLPLVKEVVGVLVIGVVVALFLQLLDKALVLMVALDACLVPEQPFAGVLVEPKHLDGFSSCLALFLLV